MIFSNKLFIVNNIYIKKLSYFRSIIKINSFNNSYCDSLGNFIRRTIFLTNFCYRINYLKIYNVKSEFDDKIGFLESTKIILNNIEDIIFSLKNSFSANLIIKKKGPCIVYAKDIYCDEKIIIFNPNKIIVHINNDNWFFTIMKCTYTSLKFNINKNFKFFLFDSNIIYLNNYKNSIINVNYFVKKKFYNKKIKTLFFDIETDGSINAIETFKNCVCYLKKYFDLMFSLINISKKKVLKINNIFNSFYLKPIEILNFKFYTLEILKKNDVFLIADLISKSKSDLYSFKMINNDIIEEIFFILKNKKLNLNTKIKYDK